MRYLGVDYGARRIGLALSDPEGGLAFPYRTVRRAEEVAAVARREGAGVIVVGLPRSASGRETGATRAVRAFAARLGKALQLPVAFEDERFTTKLAELHSPREASDASAAALILQSYLDRRVSKFKIQKSK